MGGGNGKGQRARISHNALIAAQRTTQCTSIIAALQLSCNLLLVKYKYAQSSSHIKEINVYIVIAARLNFNFVGSPRRTKLARRVSTGDS